MIHWRLAVVGVVFGFSLSRIGFSSWDEVHRMFAFTDLRLLLAFVFAVAILAAGWRVVATFSDPKPDWAPRAIHRGSIWGGVLFGAGWALSGACPSIALVQLGEGQLVAVWTLSGVFLGNYLYAVVRERWLHWATTSCVDD